MRCTHPGRSRQHCDRSAYDSSGPVGGRLLPGELAISDPMTLHGWRYESAEVPYDRKTLMVGGPLLFLLCGAVSALRNRSVRRAAEAHAAPQWRPLGPLTILPTADRLLVWHQTPGHRPR